jgi:hypothetical protein
MLGPTDNRMTAALRTRSAGRLFAEFDGAGIGQHDGDGFVGWRQLELAGGSLLRRVVVGVDIV